MLIKKLFLVMIFCGSMTINGQTDSSFVETDLSINEMTDGTLTTPASGNSENLVIFIQGSGPTDRNGNQPMMKNDGIKKIARELAAAGIASFRFDKRIFKMQQLQMKEKDLRFEDFVKDVVDIETYFRKEAIFKHIILAGHSEGSLIGMLAAKDHADAFISLAGAGEPIDNIVVAQINIQAPPLAENARVAFDDMKENGQTTQYNPMLSAIFRPSVQPFMNSWMKYDPSEEIAKLDIPMLIINGSKDIQVTEEQAEMLAEAAPEAELEIIDGMNHIFRNIESEDRLVNTKSYNEPLQPLHPELVPLLTEFVKSLE
ncbi:MAG: alpha/beta hydrolase [Christiangramia sp.]